MIWLLIAGGLVFVAALVFVLALCAAAAAGDRVVEAASWRDNLEDVETDRLLLVDELHRHAKRPGDTEMSRGMTEDR